MSVQATTWVWEHSEAKGNTRLVLLAIADAANREGQNSWQSANTIATMCKISSRTVQRCLADLLEMGEIQKDGTMGEFHTNIYSLPGVLTHKPVRQNDVPRYDTPDVRQNDVYDKMGTPLRQNGHTATTLMSYNPINPNISKDIYPNPNPTGPDAHGREVATPKKDPAPADFYPPQTPKDAANYIYYSTAKAVPFMGVLKIVEQLNKAGRHLTALADAGVNLYQAGRPLTKTTIGQAVDGYERTGGRQSTTEKQQAMANVYQQLGAPDPTYSDNPYTRVPHINPYQIAASPHTDEEEPF